MPGEAGGRRAQNANLKVNDRSGSIVLKNSNWGSNAGPIHALAHEGDVERRSASFRRPMSAPALVLVGVGQFSRQAFDELRIELPDVRELIRNQDRIDKPALVIVDGVGVGRAIVQELSREMRHLLPGGSFDDQKA